MYVSRHNYLYVITLVLQYCLRRDGLNSDVKLFSTKIYFYFEIYLALKRASSDNNV